MVAARQTGADLQNSIVFSHVAVQQSIGNAAMHNDFSGRQFTVA
jgi:hypothetical protein